MRVWWRNSYPAFELYQGGRCYWQQMSNFLTSIQAKVFLGERIVELFQHVERFAWVQALWDIKGALDSWAQWWSTRSTHFFDLVPFESKRQKKLERRVNNCAAEVFEKSWTQGERIVRSNVLSFWKRSYREDFVGGLQVRRDLYSFLKSRR